MKILVVTAVEAERDAVLRGVQSDGRFDVISGGAGTAAAAASAAKAIALAAFGNDPYKLVVCAGIGGGFAGRAEVGSIVVADRIIAADLGAETPVGFRGIDELGFGSVRAEVDSSLAMRLADAMQSAGLRAALGPVLTVATVTGTAETASELTARVPDAAAEAMEGYGVAAAAKLFGLPVLEVRAVSNAVGPRDRTTWRIGEALEALAAASALFGDVFEGVFE